MTVKLIHGDISTRDENFTPINSALVGLSRFFFSSKGLHLVGIVVRSSLVFYSWGALLCAPRQVKQSPTGALSSARRTLFFFLFRPEKEKKIFEIGNQLELRPTSKATLMCFLFKFTSRRTSRRGAVDNRYQDWGFALIVLILIAPNLSFHRHCRVHFDSKVKWSPTSSSLMPGIMYSSKCIDLDFMT